MLSLLIRVTVLFLSLLYATYSQAQLPYSKTYTTHDGLVHPQVTKLFKDSRGYIWVGTKGGVSRFNGRTFTSFTLREMHLLNQINNLSEDSKGHIWASTNEAISVFDGLNWHSFEFQNEIHNHNSCKPQHDSIYIVDRKQNIWKFYNGQYSKKHFVNATGLEINDISFNKKSNEYYFSLKGDRQLGILHGNNIELCITLHTNEVFMYSTHANSLLIAKNILDSIQILDLDRKLIKTIASESSIKYFGILTDIGKEESILWDHFHGIYNEHHELKYFFKRDKAQSEVTALLPDSSNYWIGTERGLIQVPKSGFVHYDLNKMPYPWGITEDKYGNIIVSDFISGLFKIDSKDQIIKLDQSTRWYPHPTHDSEYNVYLNNEQQLYALHNTKLYPYKNYKTKPAGENLSVYLYWSAYYDRLVSVQLGCISLLDPISEQREIIRWEDPAFRAVHGFCVTGDVHGNLWVGGPLGLIKSSPHKKLNKYFHHRKDSFPPQSILAIDLYQDSILFLGASNGLWKFNIHTEQCSPLLTKAIEFTVSSIVHYRDSLLIVGHQKGLSVIHLKNLLQGQEVAIHYNHLNGYPGMLPRQNAAYIDRNNNYWFSAYDRLCKIPVNHLWKNNDPLQLHFTKWNESAIPYGMNNLYSKTGKGNSIEFDLIGQLHKLDPKFRYRILHETEWSAWMSFQHMILPELASGEYILQIESDQTLISTGMETVSAQIAISINQELWKEPYFGKLFFIFLLLSLIAIAYFYITSFLNKKKLKLIEQESKYHQARMLTAQLNPHFMSNFLTTIQKSVDFNDSKGAVDKILQISLFLRKFLGSLRSKEKNGLINLFDELQIIRLFLEMENVLHDNSLEWSIDYDDAFNAYDWLVPPLMLQPFVENAIIWGIDSYNAKSGKIKITITEQHQHITIEIQDDGVGIDKSLKVKGDDIRKPEESGSEIVKERIALLKSLGINITYTIESNISGTKVQLTIPKIKA